MIIKFKLLCCFPRIKKRNTLLYSTLTTIREYLLLQPIREGKQFSPLLIFITISVCFRVTFFRILLCLKCHILFYDHSLLHCVQVFASQCIVFNGLSLLGPHPYIFRAFNITLLTFYSCIHKILANTTCYKN